MRKQISPKVSRVTMFIDLEPSVLTQAIPALLEPSYLTKIFTSSHAPCHFLTATVRIEKTNWIMLLLLI